MSRGVSPQQKHFHNPVTQLYTLPKLVLVTMNSIRDIYTWVTAESLLLFIEDTESSPHDNFPDTTAFVTSIFGVWTTPTGRHLLGIKVTPCLFQHIACYFREPNGVLTVEVWPRPQGFGLFDLPGGTETMTEEEYAWVLGCSVEELGLAPSTSEDLSERCIDTKLLKGTDTPEPGATETKGEGSTGTTPEEVNGMSHIFWMIPIHT